MWILVDVIEVTAESGFDCVAGLSHIKYVTLVALYNIHQVVAVTVDVDLGVPSLFVKW